MELDTNAHHKLRFSYLVPLLIRWNIILKLFYSKFISLILYIF